MLMLMLMFLQLNLVSSLQDIVASGCFKASHVRGVFFISATNFRVFQSDIFSMSVLDGKYHICDSMKKTQSNWSQLP